MVELSPIFPELWWGLQDLGLFIAKVWPWGTTQRARGMTLLCSLQGWLVLLRRQGRGNKVPVASSNNTEARCKGRVAALLHSSAGFSSHGSVIRAGFTQRQLRHGRVCTGGAARPRPAAPHLRTALEEHGPCRCAASAVGSPGKARSVPLSHFCRRGPWKSTARAAEPLLPSAASPSGCRFWAPPPSRCSRGPAAPPRCFAAPAADLLLEPSWDPLLALRLSAPPREPAWVRGAAVVSSGSWPKGFAAPAGEPRPPARSYSEQEPGVRSGLQAPSHAGHGHGRRRRVRSGAGATRAVKPEGEEGPRVAITVQFPASWTLVRRVALLHGGFPASYYNAAILGRKRGRCLLVVWELRTEGVDRARIFIRLRQFCRAWVNRRVR